MFSRSILGRGSLYLKPSSSSPLLSSSSSSSPAAATRVLSPFRFSAPRSPFSAAAPAMANTSGITPESLKETLTSKLGAEHVEIEDLSGGCGSAFHAIIVSPQFDKKTMLARHRLVNSALKEEIAAIHAWTPKCYTPEQWAKLKEEGGQ